MPKSVITFTKTESVKITLSEADLQSAVVAFLANRLTVPANAKWTWAAENWGGPNDAIVNSVTVHWDEPAETITDEVE